jgi:hypothetical protein
MRWLYGESSAHSHERAAELILEPDPALYSMLLLNLLKRVRQVRPTQAERLLASADVRPRCTVRVLTTRQRAAVAAVLRLRADRLSHRNPAIGTR